MNGELPKDGEQKRPKRRVIVLGVTFLVLATVMIWLSTHGWQPLAVSVDGRVRYLEVRHIQGTNITMHLPNILESSISRWMQNLRTSGPLTKRLTVQGPLTISNQRNQHAHVFVVEYAVKPSDGPTNRVIRAELVSTNSVAIPLIQIGDGRFGFQNRSFAYWLLNGPINAVPDTYSLRVHFPENHPVDIPVERK